MIRIIDVIFSFFGIFHFKKLDQKEKSYRSYFREIKIRVHMNSPPMVRCERGLASNDAYQSVGSSRSSLF
jgi:hypothetical protein